MKREELNGKIKDLEDQKKEKNDTQIEIVKDVISKNDNFLDAIADCEKTVLRKVVNNLLLDLTTKNDDKSLIAGMIAEAESEVAKRRNELQAKKAQKHEEEDTSKDPQKPQSEDQLKPQAQESEKPETPESKTPQSSDQQKPQNTAQAHSRWTSSQSAATANVGAVKPPIFD